MKTHHAAPSQRFAPLQHPASQRPGFTLIELLVVIAIIGILATTLIVALRWSITGARVSATKSTVKIADAILQSRIDAFRRSKWSDPDFIANMNTLPKADGAGGIVWAPIASVLPSWCDNDDLRQLFVRKYLFSRAFPQTWTEVADWMGPTSGEITPVVVNRATEPSEVLLFVLTRCSASFPVDTDALQHSSRMSDTDSNGKAELLDAWGNPIVWYRWPSRLVRPDGWPMGSTVTPTINPTDLARARVLLGNIPTDVDADPDDPIRTADPLLQTCITPPAFEDAFHTSRTYCRPLIISAGADGVLGLNSSNDRSLSRGYWCLPIGNNDLLDNITSGNTR